MRVLVDSEGAEGRGKGMAGIAPGAKKQRAKARHHGAYLLCSALLRFALLCSVLLLSELVFVPVPVGGGCCCCDVGAEFGSGVVDPPADGRSVAKSAL